jgi:hypothetical protein
MVLVSRPFGDDSFREDVTPFTGPATGAEIRCKITTNVPVIIYSGSWVAPADISHASTYWVVLFGV